jgi:hypothetical protein
MAEPSPDSVPTAALPTRDEHTWGLVAHALTFIEGGLVGPLILYMVKKDKSEFVAFHALQSFYFGLLFMIVSLFSCGILALPALIPYFVFEIIACLRAQAGEWYELPLAGPWARRAHPGPARARA